MTSTWTYNGFIKNIISCFSLILIVSLFASCDTNSEKEIIDVEQSINEEIDLKVDSLIEQMEKIEESSTNLEEALKELDEFDHE